MNRGVLLDRDGTIGEERGYICDPREFRLLPRSSAAIRLLNEHSVPVAVVSNQSGVARGYYGMETVDRVMAEMGRRLNNDGVHVDQVYYCPHHPAGIDPLFTRKCRCRKPGTGMLEKAARDLSFSLPQSFLVGDKVCDMEAARRAECRSVLVLTGYGRRMWEQRAAWSHALPEVVVEDLYDAVVWILWQMAL